MLNLVALRALSGANASGTRKLQRYILGLALVALLAQSERFLREGCLLVPAEEHGAETKLVNRTVDLRPGRVAHQANFFPHSRRWAKRSRYRQDGRQR